MSQASVSLPDAILVLTRGASPPAGFFADYEVGDDGQGGASITYWNPRLGPQPTADQLAAVTAADVTAARQQAAQVAAQALLDDPGAAGTALRAVYLAAGLTAAQVSAQLGTASAPPKG